MTAERDKHDKYAERLCKQPESDKFKNNGNELSEREKNIFQRMVEVLPIGLFCHNDEEIIFANYAAAQLVNAVSPEVFTGKSFKDFLLPEYTEIFVQKLIRLKGKRDIHEKFLAKILSVAGDVIDAKLILTPFQFKNKQVVQIAAYDITRWKKIYIEILKAEKLESIGVLAGGIAHDFNNILAIILGNISLSLKDIEPDDGIYKKLKNAVAAIEQAKELTMQLQTFAEGDKPVRTTVSLEELIREVIPFILSGSNVQYNFTFQNALFYVDIDAGQITQVINSIVNNALQAMPEGGRLEVSAENVYIKEKERECACILKNGPYVKLMIKDSGMGIEENKLKKIFDPFFSTKVKGSGLGLAVSYSIVKRHGGCIKIESKFGKGTAFFLYLPASSQKAKKKDRQG